MEYSRINIEEEIGISLDELQKMLDEIGKDETPIIRKTPAMIEKNPDAKEREKELEKFTWLHNLYVTPLSEMSKRICLKLGISFSEIPSFSNLSIMGRISKLRDFLTSKGCNTDIIVKLIPQTTKEIQLLSYAHKNGFDLGYTNVDDLTNANRLERAKSFLVTNIIKDFDNSANNSNRSK